MTRILTTPFLLADLKSWLFFAIGFGFSAIAFGDGIAFTDPYPGYGEIEVRLAAAHERYNSRKAELIDRLTEIRERASESPVK
jgi:hypothetical protein